MKAFPFDIHTLKMKFEMTSKTVIINGRSCIFRFNCHYNNEEGSMYSFNILLGFSPVLVKLPPILSYLWCKIQTGGDPKSDEVDRINELNLAYGKTSCYTPVEAKGKERYFPVVQINIPLYREPGFVLMSSVLPLFLLNMYVLVFVFQRKWFKVAKVVAKVAKLDTSDSNTYILRYLICIFLNKEKR